MNSLDKNDFLEVARFQKESSAGLPPPPRELLRSLFKGSEGFAANLDGVNYLTAPLAAQDTTIALLVLSSRHKSDWNDSDLCLLVALGEIAGPAVANLIARLRLASERQRLRQTLRETVGIIGSSKAISQVSPAKL